VLGRGGRREFAGAVSKNEPDAEEHMARGISIHLGLNGVDPAHYDGWDGALAACEADAKDMRAVAQKQRFASSTMLLTKDATSAALKAALDDAARSLVKGDLLLVTYSGHGGQVPDGNRDEPDGYDETWVLHDREFVDDELSAQWAKFARGVRIFVLSDSCHSGTVLRGRPPVRQPGTRTRLMPPDVAARVAKKHKKLYDDIQKANPAAERAVVRASVQLISGCQDNQESSDGDRNGLFTGTLRKVWRSGRWTGGHRAFRDAIARLMPPYQTPNYYRVGAADAAFDAQKPFTI
jgi:hypothetical protein